MANTRLCSIPGCGKPMLARGWCTRHYRLWQRNGDPLVFKFQKTTKTKYATKTPEYLAWSSMKSRCLNPNHTDYANYGGRGISVCQRWVDSFDAFLCDMGHKPSGERLSLDRIDNEKGYGPDNCRWATYREQANNFRANRLISINGQTKTAAEWCRETGTPRKLFDCRIRRGWSDIDAILRPTKMPQSQTPSAIRRRSLRAKRNAASRTETSAQALPCVVRE